MGTNCSRDKLSVAVVGLGHWGPNLIRAFHNHPQVDRVYGVDPSAERLELLGQKFPSVKLFRSLTDLLSEGCIDAIALAVPTEKHFELAEIILRAGKHLLVEKPLTHTAASALKLISLAQERKLILMVGNVFLFNRGIREVKNIMYSGELGEILYMRSNRSNLGPLRDDVNALWDLASHDIAIFNYLFESAPVRAACSSFKLLGRAQEDVSQGSLVYPGGKVATFLVSWLDPQKIRELTVVGDRKMLVFNDMRPERPIRIYDKGVRYGDNQPYLDAFSTYKMYIHAGNVTELSVTTGEPLMSEVEHFVAAILDGKPLESDGRFGAQVVSVLEALTLSARQEGRTISLNSL